MKKNSSDKTILAYMQSSESVEQWNERREEVKQLRDNKWITQNLDGSGLITKCSFAVVEKVK